MLEEMVMQRRAKIIIDLARVEKGEKVLILCDYHTISVGKLLAAQLYQMDAVPIFTIIPPLKAHGDPVPEPVFKMAMEVDTIIAPMMASLAHTQLRYEVLKRA